VGVGGGPVDAGVDAGIDAGSGGSASDEGGSVVTTVSGTVGGVGGGSVVGAAATSGGPIAFDCSDSNDMCPGLCFGTACDGEWQCHTAVECAGDTVAWCGCDGETFYAPSGCPLRSFQYVGECE
jgi:hypothetical protein